MVGGSQPAVGRPIDLSQEAGLTEAWQRHASELYGFAVSSLRDRADADEVLQETFVRAWRAADRYDSGRPLRPWLFAILRNVITDAQRARSARARTAGEVVQIGSDPARAAADEIDGVLDQCVLHEALLRIRDDQRTVLVETYYRGRSYADVAAELGIPEPTARTRAFYGLKALKLALEEMGWGG